jgi:putative endonuclease
MRAQAGEDAAAAHLASLGYRILERNFRIGHDEADLVALTPQGSAAIVEVKTRCGDWHGEDRVDSTKRHRLLRLAAALAQDERFLTRLFQFDVVSVQLDDALSPTVHHFPHAFDASGTPF